MGEAARDTADAIEPMVVSLQEDLVGDFRPTFIVLLGAVGLVLLIACANVANLLTIRATRRRRELAVRISLGAGLPRIRRQLMTEAVTLAVLGGVPGFLLAIWGTRALIAVAPAGIPRLSEVAVDPRILGFSVLITLATGLVFGLAPMVGLSGKGASLTLRDARTRARTERLRDLVVVTEIALSLLLVIGAGLMLRTLRVLNATDPGFDPSRVLVAHVSLPASEYEEAAAQAAFYSDALTRIRALTGVESASTILTLPMHWAIRGTFHFSIYGRAADAQRDFLAGYQSTSPDYFRTLHIPVLRGRAIEESDREDGLGVVVINEAMARRYWPASDPLGQRITFWGDPDDPDTEWATIVGVVGNTVKEGLDQAPEPEAYIPVTQAPMSRSSFVVRTVGDPYALATAVRSAIKDVDPNLPLYGLMSMDDVLASSLDQRRFRLLLLGIFAVAALALAAIGLYGVISFSVSQRTREIGIRMALGADRDTVVGHVVRQGLSRVMIGLGIGALCSLALARAIASQVFGVRATDPLTYLASSLLLAFVALAACLAPAIRAARVDPAVAVRES
jgi:putative ABC transport system permease protein